MKNFPSRVFLSLLLGVAVSLTLNAQTPKKIIGTWNQKAPNAEGYETATVVIDKQSIATTFTNGSQNTTEQVKYESDTLWYNMDVDDEFVKCYLVAEDKDNLKGFASWSTGKTDLILTRTKEQE